MKSMGVVKKKEKSATLPAVFLNPQNKFLSHPTPILVDAWTISSIHQQSYSEDLRVELPNCGLFQVYLGRFNALID